MAAVGGLVFAGSAWPASAAGSSRELFDQWRATPHSHPLVPNISQAGYRLGSPLPTPPVVATVTDFGARPDGRTDCSAAFDAALAAAGKAGGGAVYVPAGTWLLSRPVFLTQSGVVLRGAGQRRTRLYFPNPLETGYRPNIRSDNGQSRWSYTGGQVFLMPPGRKRQSEADDYAGYETWMIGAELGAVGSARRGDLVLHVDDSSRYPLNRQYVLEVTNPPDAALLKHLTGGIAGAQSYPWQTKAAKLVRGAKGMWPGFEVLRYPVRFTAAPTPATLVLEQPLKWDLRPEWPAILREPGPMISESGVEHLTIANRLITETTHLMHPGSNGVCVHNGIDCWVRDVRVEHADAAFASTGSKNITFTGVSVGGRAWHHAFINRMQSFDNLFEDFKIENWTVPPVAGALHHGLNVEGLTAGIVFRRGDMANGTFDSHRGLPFDIVRTDVNLYNDGGVGGAGDAGPYYGNRNVHWNARVLNGKARAVDTRTLAPYSATVGVRGITDTGNLKPDYAGDLHSVGLEFGVTPSIPDLYLAQRAELA
ncbi:glycosyl hydrolase family 28-related protein [Amycolatopsis suaedae]|nr:glycosyl hydrolase family 28-related protein [Amycolatopsis suaedae]